METFTPKMIETMRTEYAKINSIDPCLPSYQKLRAYLDKMSDTNLKTLRDSNIKWVSSMARHRCINRGI
jgi:hypothetical protein